MIPPYFFFTAASYNLKNIYIKKEKRKWHRIKHLIIKFYQSTFKDSTKLNMCSTRFQQTSSSDNGIDFWDSSGALLSTISWSFSSTVPDIMPPNKKQIKLPNTCLLQTHKTQLLSIEPDRTIVIMKSYHFQAKPIYLIYNQNKQTISKNF